MAEGEHSGNPGNFAEDHEKAARAGHIGGQHSSGNFANDRERAAAAGRKGGQISHRRGKRILQVAQAGNAGVEGTTGDVTSDSVQASDRKSGSPAC